MWDTGARARQEKRGNTEKKSNETEEEKKTVEIEYSVEQNRQKNSKKGKRKGKGKSGETNRQTKQNICAWRDEERDGRENGNNESNMGKSTVNSNSSCSSFSYLVVG